MKYKNRTNSSDIILTAEKELTIRFSEVDSMGIVWHGSYSLYFEDAREAFGAKYGLDYLTIFNNGFYAPLVDLSFKYKKPLTYGMESVTISIKFIPVESAKIVFEYEISDAQGEIIATGRSIQVFLDKEYNLLWENPEFYQKWKKKWLRIS